MTQTFEGLNQARQYAEEASLKSKSDAKITKSIVKGICYRVYVGNAEVKKGEKVIAHYNSGKVVK